MHLPNFLIVGAPRSGTSSLYHYLRQHPDIFMPDIKEIQYFSTMKRSIIVNDEQYAQAFAGRTHERAIGEASPSYLYDPVAPYRIKDLLGDIHIFVLLRNPADRAFSHWHYLYQRGLEPLDFSEALAAELERMASAEFRRQVDYPVAYFYFEAGRYYEQVKRYFDVFGREKVHVFITEEFVRDPVSACQQIFGILNVATDFEPDIVIHNQTTAYRYKWAHRFLARKLPAWFGPLYYHLPVSLRIRVFKAVRRVSRWNRKESSSMRLDETLRRELLERYRPDILNLEKLLGRDLALWLD